MTTTREFTNSHLRCEHCGKRKAIEADGEGREVHTCLNGCGQPEYVSASGHVSEGGHEQATCRNCHAPILWTKTIANRNMPVDAEPTPVGEYVLEYTAGAWRSSWLPVSMRRGRDLYVKHLATCTARRVA